MPALVGWVRLNGSLLLFITILALVFLFLRTKPTPGIDSLETLERAVRAGQPVVLDFYSNL